MSRTTLNVIFNSDIFEMFTNDTYAKTYQNLLLSESLTNIPESAQRKCLTLTFLAATKDLDNDTTNRILEYDLNKYLLNDSKMKVLEEKMRAKLNESAEPLKSPSVFKRIDLKDDCYKDGSCEISEVIDKNDFQNFMDSTFSRNEEETIQDKQDVGEETENCRPKTSFKTASELLGNTKKVSTGSTNNSNCQKTLGVKRSISNKFISPVIGRNNSNEQLKDSESDIKVDERLKNIEPKMVDLILSEIMDTNPSLTWDDIAGLEFAKNAIQEAVVWPLLRPDLFTGLRQPPKGILLFGPPGTGKTLIGRCVAAQSRSTFFSISASSLTSKWIGDGEKMVRALFSVARCHQPAVVFIDEIDSLLSQRSESEHECSRRMKTEFLVQLDGANTDSEERLLIIGATNRPQELDEAARRRFVKRLYIPLPEKNARFQLVQRLMLKEKHSLTEKDIQEIADLTDGYSGADMKTLCAEASMGPIRSLDMRSIENIQAAEVRAISQNDFTNALNRVKASVSYKDLDDYVKWNNTFGSGAGGQ